MQSRRTQAEAPAQEKAGSGVSAASGAKDGWAAFALGAGIQCKLEIGKADDLQEHEADRAADAVLAGQRPSIAKRPDAKKSLDANIAREEEGAPLIQRKAEGGHAPPAGLPPPPSGGGEPLSAGMRNFFGGRFGHDFSSVRIHRDAQAGAAAQGLNARAFALGEDIAFAQGEYAPGTSSGRHLLAHELAHVVQGGNSLRREDKDKEEDIANPIGDWVRATDYVLVAQTDDDRMFILPGANVLWMPKSGDAAAIADATPHFVTDMGALMEAPASGAAGTRLFRAGKRAALVIDAGADPRIPGAVYVNEIQGVMGNLGVRNISELRLIHVHADHVSEIPTIVALAQLKAAQVIIPTPYVGVNAAIRRATSALQTTTDADLVARGFGTGWTPGKVLKDKGSGDVFRYGYGIGELYVESVALRSALSNTAANPDLASYLTKVTRRTDDAKIVILGDMRGRDLATLQTAMEADKAGSWNEFFKGVKTLSGFSHHAGRMEDRDVAGMLAVLEPTLLAGGGLNVVEQTNRGQHARARADTLELMQRLGINTAIVELPGAGATSGAGATKESVYGRGPAASQLSNIPSALTDGFARMDKLRQAKATIEIWTPWFSEVHGTKSDEFIKQLLPQIDSSQEQLRNALRSAAEATMRVRTGGGTLASGARDYSSSGGTRGTAYDAALGAIPAATPAETAITTEGFTALAKLRNLPEREIPLRVALHAAMVKGIYSDKAFAHLLGELEPSRRNELLSGKRGGLVPKIEAFKRIRSEVNFRRSVLGSGDVLRIPQNWSGGAKFGAGGVAVLMIALELWNSIGMPLLQAQQSNSQVFRGKNLLPFLRRLLFWNELDIKPSLVGVKDPTFGSPTLEKDYDKIVANLNKDNEAYDAVYFDLPVIGALDVMKLGARLAYHVRNYDEFATLFHDAGQDAVSWEAAGSDGWASAIWKVKYGQYETEGDNHVEEKWYPHTSLTQLMNVHVKNIIANTDTLLGEKEKTGSISAESEDKYGTLELGSDKPLYRAKLRAEAESTDVLVSETGSVGAMGSSPASGRLSRTVTWWSKPAFLVYMKAGAYTQVSGADYNTYAILRKLTTKHHEQVIAQGTIGADRVTEIGNTSGKAWIKSDLLTEPPTTSASPDALPSPDAQEPLPGPYAPRAKDPGTTITIGPLGDPVPTDTKTTKPKTHTNPGGLGVKIEW